jgi:UDP:flavonoid glycosyltransferase YjiC (YdhE family)
LKSVLFGWELGANLGHAKPLAEIARGLISEDVRLFVAARDLSYASTAFEGLRAQLLQAPVWPDHHHFGSDAGQACYSDVLVQIGFAEPQKLAAVVGGWIALFDLVRPDVIVADHSPALLLAAKTRDIAVVHVGTGFTMPPVDYDRLPPIRADRAPIMPDARIVAAAMEVAAKHGGWTPRNLAEIFRTNARIVFGCPELDAYAPFRREAVCLPPEILPEFVEAPVEPRLFVYLGMDLPNLDGFVQILTELGVPLSVYLRGGAGPLAKFLSLRGHGVYESPPPLADVLPNASHVVSAGGAFTCQAALAAGRPMLGVPLHGEAELNVAALERMGVGRRLDPSSSEGKIRETVTSFLRDHRLLQQARHWAKVLALRVQPSGADAAAAAIRQCLNLVESDAANPLPRPARDALKTHP